MRMSMSKVIRGCNHGNSLQGMNQMSRGGFLVQRGSVARSHLGRTLVPREALQPFQEMW